MKFQPMAATRTANTTVKLASEGVVASNQLGFFNDANIVRSRKQNPERLDFAVLSAVKEADSTDFNQAADRYRVQKAVQLGGDILGDKNRICALQHQGGLEFRSVRIVSNVLHHSVNKPPSQQNKIRMMQAFL